MRQTIIESGNEPPRCKRNPGQYEGQTLKGTDTMAKAIALDFSKLNATVVDTDKRSITSDAVQRPTREIIGEIHANVRSAVWQTALQTIAAMHGNPVYAKGSNYDVNDDEAARAIRVNYNLLQPDFYPSKRAKKMTKESSQALWAQICEMMDKPAPTFTETNDEGDTE